MKEILLTSIVAATLIISGCGGSSSSSKSGGDNNGSQVNGGGDNNGSQNNGGGDNNDSQGSADNSQTWTPVTQDVKTWAEANTICSDNNKTLPSIQWFKAHSKEVKESIGFGYKDGDLNDTVDFNSVLWASDAGESDTEHGAWAYFRNTNGEDINISKVDEDGNTNKYFYTRIKQSQ